MTIVPSTPPASELLPPFQATVFLQTSMLSGSYPRLSGSKRGMPPPSSSSSAASRKNKLQRCSVCGGLGHKSRTCPENAERLGPASLGLSGCLDDVALHSWASEGSDQSGSWSDDSPDDDPFTVHAACSLVALSSGKTCIPRDDLPSKYKDMPRPRSFSQLLDLSSLERHPSRRAQHWSLLMT